MSKSCTPADLIEIKEAIDKPTELYAKKFIVNAPVRQNVLLEYTDSIQFQPNFRVSEGVNLQTKQILEE